MWVWVQMSLMYGIGSWMWDLGWKIVWGLLSRKRGNETRSRGTENETETETETETEIVVQTETEPIRVRPAEVSVPTPLVLRTEPSVPKLDAGPVAVPSQTSDIEITPVVTKAKAKHGPVGEPSLQASALEVLTHLVSDNDAFEKTTNEAFEKLDQADL
jgi:hypothetical protein